MFLCCSFEIVAQVGQISWRFEKVQCDSVAAVEGDHCHAAPFQQIHTHSYPSVIPTSELIVVLWSFPCNPLHFLALFVCLLILVLHPCTHVWLCMRQVEGIDSLWSGFYEHGNFVFRLSALLLLWRNLVSGCEYRGTQHDVIWCNMMWCSFIGTKSYADALEFFTQAIAYPGGSVSAVMVASLKKARLVSLIAYGKPYVMPS